MIKKLKDVKPGDKFKYIGYPNTYWRLLHPIKNGKEIIEETPNLQIRFWALADLSELYDIEILEN